MLKEYQDKHVDNFVIQGVSILGNAYTKTLVDNGYLQMVVKGWYIPSYPGAKEILLYDMYLIGLLSSRI